jgi:hypothetical protein
MRPLEVRPGQVITPVSMATIDVPMQLRALGDQVIADEYADIDRHIVAGILADPCGLIGCEDRALVGIVAN